MDRETLIQAPRELRTPRLWLAAPRPDFVAPFVESLNRSLPGLEYIAWAQHPQTMEWGARFMEGGRQAVEAGEFLVFHAFLHGHDLHDGHVGRVDLHSWDFEAPRCEVGYVGDVRHAGQGLMREAVLACVQLAFGLGAARVQALSEADNARALHFAEQALGFVREGVLRNFERDAQGRLGAQVMFAAYNPAAR
ncbi:MAG: GNAT family N-acetyltransferase [Rubrivivax sp.]|nr:GNAT family N-acetyltransferase [Rubrivivax sp.]